MNYIKSERAGGNLSNIITVSALRCVKLSRTADISQSDILLPIDYNRAELWNQQIERKLQDTAKEERTRKNKNAEAMESAKKVANSGSKGSLLTNPALHGYSSKKAPDVFRMKVVQGYTSRLRSKLGKLHEEKGIAGLYKQIRKELLNECDNPAKQKVFKRDAFQQLADSHHAFMEDDVGPWKCLKNALLEDYQRYAYPDELPDKTSVDKIVVAFFRRQDGIINLGYKADELFLKAASLRDKYIYDILPDFIRWDILSNWKLYEAIERENEDVAAGKDDELPVPELPGLTDKNIQEAIRRAIYGKTHSYQAENFLKQYAQIYRDNPKITKVDAIDQIQGKIEITVSDQTLNTWINHYRNALNSF